jgi:MFS family permease
MYYGWWIVIGMFGVLTVSSGFGFYNLSVYLNVLVRDTGFPVSAVSFAITLFFLIGGVGGIVIARLINVVSIRVLMIGGAFVGGASLAMASQVESLGEIYFWFALFGLCNCAVSIVVSTTLITRWFPGANRSIALSLTSTGLSFGGIVITPLSAWIIDIYGYAQSMQWFGAAFFFFTLPVVLLIIRNPPTMASDSLHAKLTLAGWTYKDALQSRFFWMVSVAFVFCMGAQVGGISHLFNRAETSFGLGTAALAIQVLTLASISGRLLGGWIVMYVPIRGFTIGCALLQGLGLGIIGVADSPALLLLGAGCFGAALGNLLMLHPLWLAEVFGNKDYPRIFALSNAISVIGVASGPFVLGFVHDGFSYSASYLTASSLALFAVSIFVFSRSTPQPVSSPVQQ